MLGKRKAQRALFDVGNVFPVALDPASFHGQLAGAADRLFADEVMEHVWKLRRRGTLRDAYKRATRG